jgi:hypothetical protein
LSIASVTLDVSEQTIGVGLEAPIILTVTVVPEGAVAGEEVRFKATGGTFNTAASNPAVLEGNEAININGQATAVWFAPRTPGTVRFSISILNRTAEARIEVTPVPPEIVFVDLPDSLSVGQTTLFQVRIPSAWAGKAVEIQAPQASLQAAGPVADNLQEGTRILPLTDETGAADVLLLTPDSPQQMILTASLFGTIQREFVEVKPE